MNVQLNHDWLIGSDIRPHLHWWQANSNIPNWLVQYRWQVQGATKVTAWSGIPWSGGLATYASGVLNQITNFGSISPPVSAGLSDIVQFRLLRDTDNDSGLFSGTDPYTGNVDAVNFDIHYQIDGFGSDEEYIKEVINVPSEEGARYLENGTARLLEDGTTRMLEDGIVNID